MKFIGADYLNFKGKDGKQVNGYNCYFADYSDRSQNDVGCKVDKKFFTSASLVKSFQLQSEQYLRDYLCDLVDEDIQIIYRSFGLEKKVSGFERV